MGIIYKIQNFYIPFYTPKLYMKHTYLEMIVEANNVLNERGGVTW